MPYRDLPHRAACHRHASAPADATCTRCEESLCEPCVFYVSTSPHCATCASTVRLRRAIRAVVSIGSLVGAVLLVIVLGLNRWARDRDQEAEVEREHAAIEREHAERLRAAPHEYEEAFYDTHDYAHAVAEATLLMQADPTDFDYIFWRAQAYERLAKLREAEADYRAILKVWPGLEKARFALADMLAREINAEWCRASRAGRAPNPRVHSPSQPKT